jgi:hypothetical protein
MKRLFTSICVASVLATATVKLPSADKPDTTGQIEEPVRAYFKASSEKDLQGIRAVLDQHVIAVKCGDNAKVGPVDTADSKQILPPNDEWAKPAWDSGKIRLSFLKTEVSATEGSVAVVSFRLTFPKDDKQIEGARWTLKRIPSDMPPPEASAFRKRMEAMISERAMHFDLFATLAKRDGVWKIVCISLPP